MPKKTTKKKHLTDRQTRIETVLKAVFGGGGLAPVMIDLSDVVTPLMNFELALTEHQRKSLIDFTHLPARLIKKLRNAGPGKQTVIVTRTELDELNDEIGGSARYAPAADRKRLMAVQSRVVKLFEQDHHDLLSQLSPPTKKSTNKPSPKPTTIYQFKLTLLGIKPKIWRRIQIPDYKLHNLHLHIQAAMGWDNKHLHHFDIKGERHGIPEHLDYDGDGSIIDSKKIRVSEIVPKDGKKIAFRYTYDFGDNWEHEVLFEGIVEPDPKTKYPICLEGERACPPEDCGGIGGYEYLLEALADPRHEEHKGMKEWVGDFDPEKFESKIATVRMVRGLR